MGAVISQAANSIGGVVGNAFVAPFKSVFGGSCEDICAGAWDVVCFIEHLCVSNLVKLLMILGLCYITLMFLYLLYKLGICQCIGRSLCKMCWATCEAYWHALQDITCFMWRKLKNTKRVNRRRRRRRRIQDIEEVGYSSSESSDKQRHISISRKRKSLKKGRKDGLRTHFSSGNRSRRLHHVRMSKREASVRVKGRSRRLRHSRQLQLGKTRNIRRDAQVFKRQRIM